MPHRSTEVCSAGLDFQVIFYENEDKIVSVPLCPDRSKNAQLAIVAVKDQVTKYDVPNTVVRHAYRLSVPTGRSPRTVAGGRQHSGKVLGCVY